MKRDLHYEILIFKMFRFSIWKIVITLFLWKKGDFMNKAFIQNSWRQIRYVLPFFINIIWLFSQISRHCGWYGKVFANYLTFISHGASEASGVRIFWHLSAKILYTVEPKSAASPCVHFEVAATADKTSFLHVSILSHFEIVEIIGPNTREIIWSASFCLLYTSDAADE